MVGERGRERRRGRRASQRRIASSAPPGYAVAAGPVELCSPRGRILRRTPSEHLYRAVTAPQPLIPASLRPSELRRARDPRLAGLPAKTGGECLRNVKAESCVASSRAFQSATRTNACAEAPRLESEAPARRPRSRSSIYPGDSSRAYAIASSKLNMPPSRAAVSHVSVPQRVRAGSKNVSSSLVSTGSSGFS